MHINIVSIYRYYYQITIFPNMIAITDSKVSLANAGWYLDYHHVYQQNIKCKSKRVAIQIKNKKKTVWADGDDMLI